MKPASDFAAALRLAAAGPLTRWWRQVGLWLVALQAVALAAVSLAILLHLRNAFLPSLRELPAIAGLYSPWFWLGLLIWLTPLALALLQNGVILRSVRLLLRGTPPLRSTRLPAQLFALAVRELWRPLAAFGLVLLVLLVWECLDALQKHGPGVLAATLQGQLLWFLPYGAGFAWSLLWLTALQVVALPLALELAALLYLLPLCARALLAPLRSGWGFGHVGFYPPYYLPPTYIGWTLGLALLVFTLLAATRSWRARGLLAALLCCCIIVHANRGALPVIPARYSAASGSFDYNPGYPGLELACALLSEMGAVPLQPPAEWNSAGAQQAQLRLHFPWELAWPLDSHRCAWLPGLLAWLSVIPQYWLLQWLLRGPARQPSA